MRGLLLFDLIALGGGLWLAAQVHFGQSLQDPNNAVFVWMYAIFLPVRPIGYALFGLYRTDLDESLLDLLYRIFWVCAILTALEWLFLLGIRNYVLINMGVSGRFVLGLGVGWAAVLVIHRWITGRYRAKWRSTFSKTLFVGQGSLDPDLYREIRDLAAQGSSVAGFVGKELVLPGEHFPVLGTLEQLPKIIEQESISHVIVVNEQLARDRLSWLLGHCEAQGVRLGILPSLYEVMIGRIRITYAYGIPLVEIGQHPLSAGSKFLKRALDIVFSAIGLVGAIWLWLAVTVLIKLDDGGPVIERVPCLGLGGRSFDLFRFRTTELPQQSSGQEPLALTPIGFVLTRLDLHRLPQLLNVLLGDLSLVGPRPMTPDFFKSIVAVEPLYRHCFMVKPGVTGLAQIHGQTHQLLAKLRYDLSYINNCSFLLDLKILFQSISVLVTGRKIRA